MLQWSTITNCPGQLVVISDALASPGEFILHDLVSNSAKTSDAFTVLVSLNEPFEHWRAIASRLSRPSNLVNSQAARRLAFIDYPLQLNNYDNDGACLQGLYDQIEKTFSTQRKGSECSSQAGPSQIIVDGLSELHWMGLSLVKLQRFTRALFFFCQKVQATLIIRVHRTMSSEHDDLLQSLLRTCSLHVEVLPLSSGRSGAISGEIAIHHGCNVAGKITDAIARSKAVQYRLADSGAVYFHRGTGAGVL